MKIYKCCENFSKRCVLKMLTGMSKINYKNLRCVVLEKDIFIEKLTKAKINIL